MSGEGRSGQDRKRCQDRNATKDGSRDLTKADYHEETFGKSVH